MIRSNEPKRYSKWVAYAAPIILTLLFAAVFSFALYGKGALQERYFFPTLVVAGIIYIALMIAVIKYGLSSIRYLEALGLTDSLSLLPNRRALHLDIRRHSDKKCETAIAMIDIDDFKTVNDHYGHNVGDRLIKRYAALLEEICAGEGHVYRLGGDEFAIVFFGQLAGNLLEGICKKLLLLTTRPINIDDRAIALGSSIGLTRSPSGEPVDSSELLRQADIAMYVSKASGKMRCTWYNPLFDENRELMQILDKELRTALVNDEFSLVYQPLVSATDGKIVAVEALIRWNRPDGKLIGPNIFIPAAEQSGVINGIGLWVLRKAIQDSLHWNDITISVNVSAAQLRNPDFPVDLGNLLEEYDFPPSRLELEVTETQLVVDSDQANRSLEIIRRFGVRVALDDFGTGYASIGFLRTCKFEKLKLDRSMIMDAIENDSSRAMLIASITLAKALDMGITAEGVETEDQAKLAREAGCDQIQGWLYHKAMPLAEFEKLLSNQKRSQNPHTITAKAANF